MSAPVSATNPPWRKFKDVEGKRLGIDKNWVAWSSTPQSTPPGFPRGDSSLQNPGTMFASDDAAGMAIEAASSRGEKTPGEMFAEHVAALTRVAKQEQQPQTRLNKPSSIYSTNTSGSGAASSGSPPTLHPPTSFGPGKNSLCSFH